MHRWLEGFAYRIELSPLYFIAAGVVAFLLVVATLSVHGIITARARPVVALPNE